MTELQSILIVSGDLAVVAQTQTALADYRLSNPVVVVEEGALALAYLLRRNEFAVRPAGNPAVVLLDLTPSPTNSLDVLRELRADAQFRSLPVVIVATVREQFELVQDHNHCPTICVLKPVDFRELARAFTSLGLFWVLVPSNVPLA